MSPREPTPGEIADDVSRIERHMETLLPRELFGSEMRSISKDIDALGAKLETMSLDIAAIKDRGEANRRIFLSGVIFPVLVIIVGGLIAAGMVTP